MDEHRAPLHFSPRPADAELMQSVLNIGVTISAAVSIVKLYIPCRQQSSAERIDPLLLFRCTHHAAREIALRSFMVKEAALKAPCAHARGHVTRGILGDYAERDAPDAIAAAVHGCIGG
jgi:hypothetical protein